jgi:hypothetical protein
MSDTTLNLELDHGPWEGAQYDNCWPAGGVVTGRVSCYAQSVVKARGVRIDLGWATSGRGDRDKSIVASVDLHKGNLGPTRSYNWRFEIPIPEDGPISYQGHLITIEWKIWAIVDRPFARDEILEEVISILPDYDRV